MTIGKLRARPRWTTPNARQCGQASDSLRSEATRLMNALYSRARKLYGQHVSAREVSAARHTGGPLAALVRFMRANPEAAPQIAAFVQAVADSLQGVGCPKALTLAGVRANAGDEIASAEFLHGEITRAEIEALLDAKRRDMAADRQAAAALTRALENV